MTYTQCHIEFLKALDVLGDRTGENPDVIAGHRARTAGSLARACEHYIKAQRRALYAMKNRELLDGTGRIELLTLDANGDTLERLEVTPDAARALIAERGLESISPARYGALKHGFRASLDGGTRA